MWKNESAIGGVLILRKKESFKGYKYVDHSDVYPCVLNPRETWSLGTIKPAQELLLK